MYQKNYKSARALVYKGFSKFVGLDENWTKAINLPKPSVLEIASNQYFYQTAPVELSEPSDFTPKSSSFTPYPPFLSGNSSYLGWHWQRRKALTITLTLTSIREATSNFHVLIRNVIRCHCQPIYKLFPIMDLWSCCCFDCNRIIGLGILPVNRV